jgi:hypothetical protein
MAIGLFRRDAITAASFSFDLAAETQINHAGPYKVSLVGWCDTPDALAGFLIFTMTHRTPNGVDLQSPHIGGAINLADGASYFSTPRDCIVRQSSGSLWTLDATLAGVAGSSLASYRLIVEPLESTDYSAIGAGVTP